MYNIKGKQTHTVDKKQSEFQLLRTFILREIRIKIKLKYKI